MSTPYDTVVDQIIQGLVLIGQGWWNSIFQSNAILFLHTN